MSEWMPIEIERTDAPLIDLVDGRARLNFFLSNFCDEDLDETLVAWLESDKEVCISTYTSLPEILDAAIDGHSSCGLVSPSGRPLLDAMRADLVNMIARIDSLAYSEPPK